MTVCNIAIRYIAMGLKELSKLQFAILQAIGTHEVRGKEIRDRLKSINMGKSSPAFYQLMGRMEDANLISGRYDKKIIDGQLIRERKYKIKADGRQALGKFKLSYEQITALGRVDNER